MNRRDLPDLLTGLQDALNVVHDNASPSAAPQQTGGGPDPRASADVRRFSSRGGGAAGSISAFAQPVELLSCAGSCAWGGIYTCAPLLTSLCARCAPLLTPLVPCCAPLVTPLVPCCAPLLTPVHANGLSFSIGYCQYRRNRREAERSRQSHQRKGFSAGDNFRLDDCTHVKPS
jgi:hypothetical protein